jgi:hypothetical protein
LNTRNDDEFSDFSNDSQEDEIGINENILDFKVQSVEYNDHNLFKAMGLSTSQASQYIKTFVMIDFFANESLHTDVKEGLNPNFDTIFCFKNLVDNFYIKQLKTECIKAEIYAVTRGAKQSTIKIGEAELPLQFLFDHKQSYQLQNIHVCENGIVNPDKKLGKIYFKARMRNRKSLETALEFYDKDVNAKEKLQKPTEKVRKIEEDSLKKVFTINVKGAEGLRREGMIDRKKMMPFYSYEFYCFDYRSATAYGIDPVWDNEQKYEVDYNQEFIRYLEHQLVRIDFCDTSVEISNNTGKDYIGTAYIPLKQLLSNNDITGKHKIKNGNMAAGTVEVTVSL